MPFGLCNAPSTFQSLMNHVFRPFLRHFVLVFFDDILIYIKTWKDYLTHVDQVLSLLAQHQFFLKQSKCAFGASEVEYLGHLVGKDGVRVDPKNIEAMQDWPHPKTLKSLRGFLGLTGYYRKFVKNYGKIAAPLTTLRKNNSFTWTPDSCSRFSNFEDGHVHHSSYGSSRIHKDICVGMRRIRERHWRCPYASGSTFGLYEQTTV
jgi:hypothetical protein